MRRVILYLCFICVAIPVAGQTIFGPFDVSVSREKEGSRDFLKVIFRVPNGTHLYAEDTGVRLADGRELEPVSIRPGGVLEDDAILGRTSVYKKDTTIRYELGDEIAEDASIEVYYRGCRDKACYAPATKTFSLSTLEAVTVPGPPESGGEEPGWVQLADRFSVVARDTESMSPEEFLKFLEEAGQGKGLPENRLELLFRGGLGGVSLGLILILIGGAGLNLTPCVLPMIPVNIAIIGAGTKAGSKSRGFLIGGAYGLAMALVYGALGYFFVKTTGARFGTLNSNVWFNTGIAVIFLVLSLAMFDVFALDFSRVRAAVETGGKPRGGVVTAFVMGGVAALLAGACVAPVVVSVLLLSAKLYSHGKNVGLILPFLLGLGMGLPWPFLGAGLSFLPKPGRWMTHVKHAFGVIIIGFAIYYGVIAVKLFRWRTNDMRNKVIATQEVADSMWDTSLERGLRVALDNGRPVLIDFWASWCKNCLAMNRTFKNTKVRERLSSFANIKYRAEDMSDKETRMVLDYFHVVGLPTYVVLMPKSGEERK